MDYIPQNLKNVQKSYFPKCRHGAMLGHLWENLKMRKAAENLVFVPLAQKALKDVLML